MAARANFDDSNPAVRVFVEKAFGILAKYLHNEKEKEKEQIVAIATVQKMMQERETFTGSIAGLGDAAAITDFFGSSDIKQHPDVLAIGQLSMFWEQIKSDQRIEFADKGKIFKARANEYFATHPIPSLISIGVKGAPDIAKLKAAYATLSTTIERIRLQVAGLKKEADVDTFIRFQQGGLPKELQAALLNNWQTTPGKKPYTRTKYGMGVVSKKTGWGSIFNGFAVGASATKRGSVGDDPELGMPLLPVAASRTVSVAASSVQ